MKVVGLLVARDEEIVIGMTIDSVKPIVDEIVFVDNSSIDRTAEIVRDRCKANGIPLFEYKAGLDTTFTDLRRICYEHGLERKPDWFFTIDGDMVYTNQDKIRALAGVGGYGQHWMVSMNIYGDLDHSCGLNIPHMLLFRNRPGVVPGENYCISSNTHSVNPNNTLFYAWNFNGIKTVDHIFWRYQLWYCNLYNKKHKTNLSIDQYMREQFRHVTEYDYDVYKKVFVLNRLRMMCVPIYKVAAANGMSEAEFRRVYMSFPQALKDWKPPYELLLDVDGSVIGRMPDLEGVPVLKDEDIWQMKKEFLDDIRSA